MELTLSQWLVIGICGILILGYIAGYYYNRQQAGKILDWLRAGLQKWGAVSAGEKLPGMLTGGRLLVQKASSPFQRMEAVYLLAPRENLLFWLFHAFQGRGDELVLKINLSKIPKGRLEAKRRGHSGFTFTGQAADEKVSAFLTRHERGLSHLILKGESTHLFLRIALQELMRGDAVVFLAELAEAVA